MSQESFTQSTPEVSGYPVSLDLAMDVDSEVFGDEFSSNPASEVGTELGDPLQQYYREISRIPLISKECVVGHAKNIKAGISAEEELIPIGVLSPKYRQSLEDRVEIGRDSQRQLCEANLRLVVSIAEWYAGNGVSMLDLIQEGNIALIKAVEKFDHTKGFAFSTNAVKYISGAMRRALGDQAFSVRLPANAYETLLKVNKVRGAFYEQNRRWPTSVEVAEEIEEAIAQGRLKIAGSIDAKKVDDYLTAPLHVPSLNVPLPDDGGKRRELADVVPDINAVDLADNYVQASGHEFLIEGLVGLMNAADTQKAMGIMLLREGAFLDNPRFFSADFIRKHSIEAGRRYTRSELADIYDLSPGQIARLEDKGWQAAKVLRTNFDE